MRYPGIFQLSITPAWLLAVATITILGLSGCNTPPQKPVTPAAVTQEDTTAQPPDNAAQVTATANASTPEPQTRLPNAANSAITLSTTTLTDSESPRNDGIHDTTNAAIDILQDPRDALKDFPRDRRQQVDWVQSLNQGLIEPRADLYGKEPMAVFDKDILMKNTQSMPWVKFPHRAHTQWLGCDNCHPSIFEAKEGANPITMNKVLRGEYCGVCHDKVAFALFICERCHSVPHAGSGEKWW